MDQNPLMTIVEAEANLWASDGRNALEFLHEAGLTDETIRRARIGWSGSLWAAKSRGLALYPTRGITFPWFSELGAVVLIRVFRESKRGSNWIDVYRAREHPVCYPHPGLVVPDCTLILASDVPNVLLLQQELPETVVICLDSPMHRISTKLGNRVLLADQRICAHNNVTAYGEPKLPDASTGDWIRVEPPEPNIDWVDVHRNGLPRIAFVFGNFISRPGGNGRED